MGVWIGDQKVGWVYTLERPEEDGYRITQRTKLELSVMGQVKSIETLTQSDNLADYKVQNFLFELLSDEHSYKVDGRMSGRELVVDVLTGGEERTESVQTPEGVYLPLSIGRAAVSRKLKARDVVRLPIYDPSVLSLLDATVSVEGVETLTLPDYEGEATKLQVNMLNLETASWIDGSGWVVKAVAPMGLTMERTTRENAMKLESGEALLEILTHYSVPSSVTIPDARRVRLMVVELSGVDDLPDLKDERQSILSSDPVTVKIVTRPQAGGGHNEDDLGSTPLIQSDAELIREKALSIVEGADSDSTKVERLVDWLFKNIDKTPTVSFPSALDVLKSGQGDCNEHAVLFCALARSLSIPSRVCVGLVYQKGSFYYHAWNKVWIDRWVACDPTFGQLVADATHLKLLEGDLAEQLKVANIIGNLQIAILEFE